MRISDWSSDVCSSDLFLRQQIRKREGRANMCLADFILPENDWIGGFAVTAGHGVDEHVLRFKADNDDYSAILVKALADRLAEAFAERMHQHRSEERRVGKECVCTCRSRWWPCH